MAQMLTSYSATFNSGTEITQQKWGVTLINKWSGSKLNSSLKPDIPHCEMLIEGLSETGDKIQKVVDLNVWEDTDEPCRLGGKSVAQVGIKDLSEKHIKQIDGHTKTWLLAKNKVEKFLQEKEKEKNKEFPFFLHGGKSIFSDKSDVFNIHHPILAAISRANRELFKCLYDSSRNGGLCTGMSKERFEKEIDSTLDKIENTAADPDGIFRDETLEYVEDKDFRYLGQKYTYGDLIKLMDQFVDDTEKVRQESCVTWAQKQCESLGIPVNDSMTDKLVTLPPLKCDVKKGKEVEPEDLTQVQDNVDNDSNNNNHNNNKPPLCGRHVTTGHRRVPTPEDVKKILNEAYNNVADTETMQSRASLTLGFGSMFGVALIAPPVAPFVGIGVGMATSEITYAVRKPKMIEKNNELLDKIDKSSDAVKQYIANHPEKTECLDPDKWRKVMAEMTSKRNSGGYN